MIFGHNVDVKVSRATGSPIRAQIHNAHVPHIRARRNPIEHPLKRRASRNRPRTARRAASGAAPSAHELVLGDNAPDVSVFLLRRAIINSSSVHRV
jgi:hypothetical protein